MSGVSRREVFVGLAGSIGFATVSQAAFSAGDPVANSGEYMLQPGLIYLNAGSLAPTPRSVFNAVLKAWTELETNPVRMSYGTGAIHTLADKTRDAVAGLISCTAEEILLTRSTTNAMNIAALGIDLVRGDRILTTDAEHDGGSACWKYLEKRVGVVVDRVALPPELHDPKAIVELFAKAIKNETKVVSVSHVIYSTGLRMPVREITALAKSRNILTIVDGAQAVGNIEVDVKNIGCDAYAAPGHKWLMAPKGTAFLYVSNDAAVKIRPVEWTEGKSYVTGSSGMGSSPLIVGLGAAIEAAQKRGLAATKAHNLRLRDLAYEQLQTIPTARILGPAPGPLATAMVAFQLPEGMEYQPFFAAMVQKYKVVIRGLPKLRAFRISPHIFNTEEEIYAAIAAIRTELR